MMISLVNNNFVEWESIHNRLLTNLQDILLINDNNFMGHVNQCPETLVKKTIKRKF